MKAHVLNAISFLMAHEFDVMRARAAGLNLPTLVRHCTKEIDRLIHEATPSIDPQHVVHKIIWGDRVATVCFQIPYMLEDVRKYRFMEAVIQSGPADILVVRMPSC